MPDIAHLVLDEAASADLAGRLAPALGPGDTVLLEGGIGAGKTHFARHVILALLQTPEDIPSPTFTLVQVYDTAEFEIWHTDLYRLDSPDQVDELGVVDAMETALCLIEWPDRLGDATPGNALQISFELVKEGTARQVSLSSTDQTWHQRLAGFFQ